MIFIGMKRHNIHDVDPFFKYTDEERRNMTQEQYCALIEESNEYVRHRHQFETLNENEMPRFSSLQELLDYYDAIPFEEAVNNMNKLFNQ